jgi:hypothetical protein
MILVMPDLVGIHEFLFSDASKRKTRGCFAFAKHDEKRTVIASRHGRSAVAAWRSSSGLPRWERFQFSSFLRKQESRARGSAAALDCFAPAGLAMTTPDNSRHAP